MPNHQNETINRPIGETGLDDGALADLAHELYWWVDLFNIALFKDKSVPVPVITFAKTRVTSLGHYLSGPNEFGIRENINLNRIHLKRPMASILATLVHEMTHCWQKRYGHPSKSWFHNREFRLKLRSFGLEYNPKGQLIDLADPFASLLRQHGVDCNPGIKIIQDQTTMSDRPKGESKLKLWVCGCHQRARVGRREFYATCDLCGDQFHRT